MLILLAACTLGACTKLDQKVYSVVPNQNFWQTPDQIAAGIAPAYAQLANIPDGNFQNLQETPSDEQVVPARGSDWLADGQHIQLWTHTWNAETQQVRDTWTDLYSGIGKINFILSIVNSLNPAPDGLDKINAELKTLRALYYYWTMDLYGNIPLVTDFNTNPNTVTNTPRATVFSFIEKELKDNIGLLQDEVSLNTYGRVTKWMAFSLLAKLYINAGVYTGTPRWADAIKMCDSVILSSRYSLQPNYYDNFSATNEGSVENIFVVPFDHVNIGGNNNQTQTLHYQNNINFQLSSGAWNGYCANAEFYSHYDTSSVYTVKGQNTYRTFLDARAGQFLIGQQFTPAYTYPPNINVLYSSSDPTLKITDAQTGKNLSFYANIKEISNPSDTFRLAGLRNIKYFPNPGTQTSMNNDIPIFRLADILLMRAEASLRNGTAATADLGYVNQVRQRAYGGDASHDWTIADLTLPHLLDERARELAWEDWRRQDCIRFGTFGNARTPNKTADADNHWQIFPIPRAQHDANPNLKQNPGYPAF
jgi:hypothetical protein